MADQSKKKGASLTQDKYARAAALVKEVVEPKIEKLVEELNVILAGHGTMAGCEIQWFFDKLPEKPSANDGDDGDEN